MSKSDLCMSPQSVVTGWDFSTGEVKCLAFDLKGRLLAEVRLPTDLWKGDPPDENISELNLLQLEGQARASVRGIAAQLHQMGRLDDWVAGGISATHHTAGRIDKNLITLSKKMSIQVVVADRPVRPGQLKDIFEGLKTGDLAAAKMKGRLPNRFCRIVAR